MSRTSRSRATAATAQKRKAGDLVIPDIADDAAERKRVLNVLAQRRYRERKRDHLKVLEEKVGDSGITGHDGTNSPLYAIDAQIISIHPTGSHEASLVGKTSDFEDYIQPTSLSVTREFHQTLSSDGPSTPDTTASWGSGRPVNFAWDPSILLPSLPSTPSSPIFSSQDASPYSTPPTTAASPGSQDLDITAAWQFDATRRFDFPDEANLEMLELNLLRASISIAKRMNIDELIWSLTSLSPFTDPSLSSLNGMFDHLPPNLQPTLTQRTVPHHPVLDILPWPRVRDKLIRVFAQPPEMRPPLARSSTALVELVYDLEDDAEGVRVSGNDPYDGRNWEVGEKLWARWWWCLDEAVVRRSNWLRRLRGARELGQSQGRVVEDDEELDFPGPGF